MIFERLYGWFGCVDRVDVWEVANEPSHVRVEIAYRLARTGAPGAMNVTLQLQLQSQGQ